MASWTDISLSDLLPDEPWTSAKATAVYENPIALAAGETGAPKIAVKTGGGGTGGGTLSFTGLGDFGGAVFHGAFRDDSVSRTLAIALSDDGVTYATASNLFSTSAGGINGSFVITVNFLTGAVKCVHTAGGTLYATATLAGAGSGVTAVRITMSGAAALSAIILPNGGESAS